MENACVLIILKLKSSCNWLTACSRICLVAFTGEYDRLMNRSLSLYSRKLFSLLHFCMDWLRSNIHCNHCSEANIPVTIYLLAGFLGKGSGAKMIECGVRSLILEKSREQRCVFIAFIRSLKISYLKKNPTYQEIVQYILEKNQTPHIFFHSVSILLKWTKMLKTKPQKPICRNWQVKHKIIWKSNQKSPGQETWKLLVTHKV